MEVGQAIRIEMTSGGGLIDVISRQERQKVLDVASSFRVGVQGLRLHRDQMVGAR